MRNVETKDGLYWADVQDTEAWILEANSDALNVVPGPLNTVVDIGAHIGFTTLLAAQKGAHVYAFEPNVHTFGRLLAAIKSNGPKCPGTIEPFCLAVAPVSGEFRTLRMVPGSPGQSGLAYSDTIPALCTCFTVSLGEIVHQVGKPIDLLKIDCEGFEHDLLMHTDTRVFKTVRNVLLESHSIDDPVFFPESPRAAGAQEASAILMKHFGFELRVPKIGLWVRP